jgi:hypothetical protein
MCGGRTKEDAMQILTGWARVAAIGLAGVSLAAGVGRPQRTGKPSPPDLQQQGNPNPSPNPKDPFGQNQTGKPKLDEPPSPFGNTDEKQAIARNDERQKRLVSDSDKLLQLATQLHEDVSKTNPHILSVDVVHRAEEIEKLARSVKERMKGSA